MYMSTATRELISETSVLVGVTAWLLSPSCTVTSEYQCLILIIYFSCFIWFCLLVKMSLNCQQNENVIVYEKYCQTCIYYCLTARTGSTMRRYRVKAVVADLNMHCSWPMISFKLTSCWTRKVGRALTWFGRIILIGFTVIIWICSIFNFPRVAWWRKG